MVGQADAALVERDHVGDRAQREEDRLARSLGGGDARAAGAAGEIDDRRARSGIGRSEADEADVDAARGRVVAVLRHRKGAALGGKLAAVGEPEGMRLDAQRRRVGRGGGDGRSEQDAGEDRSQRTA